MCEHVCIGASRRCRTHRSQRRACVTSTTPVWLCAGLHPLKCDSPWFSAAGGPALAVAKGNVAVVDAEDSNGCNVEKVVPCVDADADAEADGLIGVHAELVGEEPEPEDEVVGAHAEFEVDLEGNVDAQEEVDPEVVVVVVEEGRVDVEEGRVDVEEGRVDVEASLRPVEAAVEAGARRTGGLSPVFTRDRSHAAGMDALASPLADTSSPRCAAEPSWHVLFGVAGSSVSLNAVGCRGRLVLPCRRCSEPRTATLRVAAVRLICSGCNGGGGGGGRWWCGKCVSEEALWVCGDRQTDRHSLID
jgi:hypothetical protein